MRRFVQKAMIMNPSASGGSSGGGSGSVDNGYINLPYAKTLSNVFTDGVFPDDCDLTLNAPDLSSSNALNQTFSQSKGIKSLTVIGGQSLVNGVSLFMCFKMITSIEKIDLTQFLVKPTNFSYCFQSCTKLTEILGEIDLSLCTNIGTVFGGCSSLKTVRLKAETAKLSMSFANSNLLSDESIQSIIDGLSDLTGADSQTISFHSDVTDKLTEAQISQITSKNWVLG